jgi:hypothetical protein
MRFYPLYSSDSEHSRGKTLIFPRLRQFLVHKLSCQINFCKMMNFQLTALSKNFAKPCVFLLLLCLGRILAPTCLVSCQPSCSPPPSSGSVGRCCSTPSAAPHRPLCGPAPRPPLLHHQSRVAGRGGCRQLPKGLHGRRCHAWQPSSPRQTAGPAPWRSCRNQAGLVFRPTGFFTFSFIGSATRRPQNRFPTRRGGFSMPGPVAPSQPPQTQYPSCHRAPPKRLDL